MRGHLIAQVAVIGLIAWPFAAAAAGFQVATNAGAAAQATGEFIPSPDFQNGAGSGDTGPVSSSVLAHSGSESGFAAGDGLAAGTIDFGYFAGKADSRAMVPRGFTGEGGTFQYFASSTADVLAVSQASFLVMPTLPFLTGTMGTVVVPIDVSGTVSATLSPDVLSGGHIGPSNAQVLWRMAVGTPSGPGAMLSGETDYTGFSSGDMPGLHTLSFNVVLGVPTSLMMQYDLHSTAGITSGIGGGGRAHGMAEFTSTFRWMGISQVLDADGNPIEYSIVSDAGIDWTQPAPAPVPVPVTLPLVLTGFAVALGFRRRR